VDAVRCVFRANGYVVRTAGSISAPCRPPATPENSQSVLIYTSHLDRSPDPPRGVLAARRQGGKPRRPGPAAPNFALVRRREDAPTRDERVCARVEERPGVRRADAAVHLDPLATCTI
jgi:hypothetical protein